MPSQPDPDRAPPWLIELPTCPSTNDWALQHLDALAHGACVWTRRQTAGRGRNGARWHAPPGVLTASFVLDVADTLDANRLALAAGLAVCHAVGDCCPGLPVMIKWPNDCVVDGRKLAGILCERSVGGARAAVVLGIGLNVDPHWDQDALALPLAIGLCPPTSLAEGRPGTEPPAMSAVIVALRRYLLEACGILAAGAWSRLAAQLVDRDWLRGKLVTVEAGGRRSHGLGAGFDDEGRLCLDMAGEIRVMASARVLAVETVTATRRSAT